MRRLTHSKEIVIEFFGPAFIFAVIAGTFLYFWRSLKKRHQADEARNLRIRQLREQEAQRAWDRAKEASRYLAPPKPITRSLPRPQPTVVTDPIKDRQESAVKRTNTPRKAAPAPTTTSRTEPQFIIDVLTGPRKPEPLQRGDLGRLIGDGWSVCAPPPSSSD